MAAEENAAEVLDVPELTAGAKKILEVASGLFYQHGIYNVGVDTIAAESGFTKRTLYDRFGSKDNLVAIHLKARHHRWWARMEEGLAAHPPSPALAFFDSYILDAETSDHGCAFINAAAELATDHPGYQIVQAHKGLVLRYLIGLIEDTHPDYDEAETVAEQVFLLMEGAIVHLGVDGDDRLLHSARDMAKRLITNGASEVELA
ncbi:TetR/AcrR family transcriptional regulator [Yaniella flava]|uniref:TetR/AcrR family transcriptional regulator n=1 Tax=Yaniella flava TaxID=287930 RepID=A0ABP5FSW4_9MICC